jgi:hypothetical protein
MRRKVGLAVGYVLLVLVVGLSRNTLCQFLPP